MPQTFLLTDHNQTAGEVAKKQSGFFNEYYRLIYVILVSFVTGTLLLIAIQYNSSLNTGRLIRDNEKLLKELKVTSSLREMDDRQQVMEQLSREMEENGRNARIYGSILVALILLSSAGLAGFIIRHLKKQHRLILQLDISERKTREAAMVKENFMANMSHEIRTPLNSILGFTNLLRRRELSSEAATFVDAIQRSGENLLSIVNDILDLAKIEAGMMRIVNAPFSMREMVQFIQTLFAERMKSKQLDFNVIYDPAVPDTLVGDATRLTQILVNLIGNALKFTERGEITLIVNGEYRTAQDIQLRCYISDTGIGISEDKLSYIFERFKQAEDAITRSYGGSGLGLSIVKDLVALQHGEITVNSELGKGTTFSFSIPYKIPDEPLI